MVKQIETMIIGGGQAGLSTSYCLTQQGREHLVLEKAEYAAPVWRNRWDSFTLITPNWMIRLPGGEYQGDDPDGFMPRDDLVAYFQDYVEKYDFPVQYDTYATEVTPAGKGYRIQTNHGPFEAANVVIATGLHQQPKKPPFYERISPEILQLHSSQYRNPDKIPAGAVLVVGSAQSGAQIAEEIYQSGRKVYLSVSDTGRIPRRYRGKDVTVWMRDMKMYEKTVDELGSPKEKFAASAHGTGKDGGHTINLHQFYRDGVTLLGSVRGAEEHKITLAADLKENLASADRFEKEFIREIDQYIETHGVDAPEETLPNMKDGYQQEEILTLNLQSAGIRSIIWATGYRFDFSMVKLPVFDKDGFPIQSRGVTAYKGMFFVGLPFLYCGKSGLLFGVGEDAAYVATVITQQQMLEHPVFSASM